MRCERLVVSRAAMGAFLLLLLLACDPAESHFHVELKMPRYVQHGGVALLHCRYDEPLERIHKVEWLKDNHRLFRFIKGRNPPFEKFHMNGATIDAKNSNEREVLLKNLDFHGSGFYSCEVTLETPIFTRPSNDEELTVIQKQREPPHISLNKGVYTLGEILEANCTSSPASPPPHVTWLVNDKVVPDSVVRPLPGYRAREQHVQSTAVQLVLPLTEAEVKLTCLATIPGFQGDDVDADAYADHRADSVTVNIIIQEANSASVDEWLPIVSALLVLLLLLTVRR